MKPPRKLVLASKSPRRRVILESLGLPFEVLVKETEEAHPSSRDIRTVILENAKAKAGAVRTSISNAETVVIAADTLVLLGNEVLGKPTDKEHARAMLKTLSGKTQTVYTGLVLASQKDGEVGEVVESKVLFRKLSDQEIDDYIHTKEPYDKAGSYAVQGLGALFIDKIEGSYTNVMGLPIENLLQLLSKLTKTKPSEWF